MAKKTKGRPRKSYTPEMKAKILEIAKTEGLTGAQVRKRFGVSLLSFYRWRGGGQGQRGPGRPKGGGAGRGRRAAADPGVGRDFIREQVRNEVRRVLPQIIRQEVEAYLRRILGG
jgi:transposase-like protein